MTQLLADKVAFITGSASGIGLEIAHKFALEGAKVVISDMNAEKCDQAVAQLQAQGFDVLSAPCDVTDEQAYQQAIAQTQQHFGRLDILINNAGFQHVATIEDFPTAVYQKLIQVMLTGSFIGIKHAFPIMKAQQYGRIINMASINGLIGFAGKAGYNSAKHGVIGLTKVAALECARDGITVNALCPGYVDTPLVRGQIADLAKTRNVSLESALEDVILAMVPQKRLLTVEEIADYAVFLASHKAAGVTGQAVVMDGGYTIQ
ncbi:3-hydroxybutyrate dehydrogenase [Acinetobacter rudis]|uniref:3-hydroxybutyrate dehydrogenase n=1 Tax=Acinetobacter rudis TaxID=632955 RepID=A0AAW8J4A3_9GAMM|nr:3-hydroxybutyrate dehydrogenase [Acinetobacter rudis]MDQ8934429.1 3-hydroxybutyrate dehydrogenase [Acinetobacter rudis]MDQ8951876.1 3-hydroxybutyrate dehydrogenase [Acinetobacter rudis]MDQ9016671.1 3-hydroxybutyrate dehydrogenase [Acinetobacter rudis]